MNATQEVRLRTGIISQEPRKRDGTEIFNLTKHRSSWYEQKMGVLEPTWKVKRDIIGLQSFPVIPDQIILEDRAHELASIAKLSGCKKILIGGPAFFMSCLEMTLCHHELEPVFVWRFRDADGQWKFGAFVESFLVEKGWLNHANTD